MNKTLLQDLQTIANADFINWRNFAGARFYITGATGLIGFTLVASLLFANKKYSLNLKVIALVRCEKRAKERFADFADEFGSGLSFAVGSAEKPPRIDCGIDYIVHGASPTSGRFFVQNPVETIIAAVDGTKNALFLAKEKNVKGFVYLSSMETYGYPEKGRKVTESDAGAFNALSARNSYPIGKIQCENLCYAFYAEYGVPARVLRLTQTFGPGVNYGDERIFAYLGRCAAEKRDIELKTKGETERSYLYSADAATAILTALQKGCDGQAYNAADETTYCSIAQMAEEIARRAGVKVIYGVSSPDKNGYADTLYMYLDASKLKELGWRPLYKPESDGKKIAGMIYRMLDFKPRPAQTRS